MRRRSPASELSGLERAGNAVVCGSAPTAVVAAAPRGGVRAVPRTRAAYRYTQWRTIASRTSRSDARVTVRAGGDLAEDLAPSGLGRGTRTASSLAYVT